MSKKLYDAEVGTRFLDTTCDIIYEIVEVPNDQYTEVHGNKRGQAVEDTSPETRDVPLDPYAYLLGSWFDREVQILEEGGK